VNNLIRQAFKQGLAVRGEPNLPGMESETDAFSKARALGIWARLEGNRAGLHFGLRCDDELTAKQLVGTWRDAWDKQVKPLAGLAPLGAPSGLGTFVRESLETTRFSGQGSVALVSAEVSTPALGELVREVRKQPTRRVAVPVGGLGGSLGGLR
jgi:hypothetical protein